MSAVDGHDGEALPDRERAHPADRGAVPVRPAAGAGRARIDRLVTSGTFSLDGGTWDVENNVWIVGDDDECERSEHEEEEPAGERGRRAGDRGAEIQLPACFALYRAHQA